MTALLKPHLRAVFPGLRFPASISALERASAISQASADIMLGMIVGRKKDEALKMGEIFLKMIKGEASEEEIDSLEEASALRDIAHMPARVKCAVLGWRTLKEALNGSSEQA